MKTATVIAVVALALALIGLATPFWLNSAYPWVSPSDPMLRGQALVTSVPFLRVALLAFIMALRQRRGRDARLPRALLILLVVLLVVPGCWLLFSVMTWKL